MMEIPSHFDGVGNSPKIVKPRIVAEIISKYWNGARIEIGAILNARNTSR